MPKKQQQEKSLSSFYFHFLQPGDAITGFLESAVPVLPRADSRTERGQPCPRVFLATVPIRADKAVRALGSDVS